MKPRIDEIAPDTFRISTMVSEAGIQFCQFLVRDEEPLLFHTGMKALFPLVREAVATLIDPSTLRWIGFSHYEPDECGSLNEWLTLAPRAEAITGLVGAMVYVNDAAARPAHVVEDNTVIATGTRRFRYLSTPQVPHGWDAGMLFEETTRTLFCSDLFHQLGDVEPVTQADVVGRFQSTLASYDSGPFTGYLPYTSRTRPTIERLASLEPNVLAPMHGSAFTGDCQKALRDAADMMHATLS